LEEWLRAFSATLADVDKAIYGTYKDHTETIIYGSNSDALINRYELIVKNINALNTDTEITYKRIIELTDMYEDIVTDVDKAKGQLRTDIRGLAKKDNEWRIFFQNKHPDIFLDKEDERCK
jgi:hypothetical protein